MRCRVCRVRITDEELGISEIGFSGLCLSCNRKFRIYHTLMRVPHDAAAK
jgi:hypothetical protein